MTKPPHKNLPQTKIHVPNLRFYNTAARSKEAFAPIDTKNVRLYVCGPTVYDFAHIGNARPLIVFDILFRLLRAKYGASHVRYARNITDVDDKINARAARDFPSLPLNAAIERVTQQTEAQFHADAEALGCLPPTEEPRATHYMAEMRALIERLAERGFAYVAEGHVLFSVDAMDKAAANGALPRYGGLSRRPLRELLAGARVEVAGYKRGAMDFVLWKPSKKGEPGWESPCGIAALGRPGWHIECSAMSMKTLLAPYGGGLSCTEPGKNIFDIHGGGHDLIFPHHENEIAQSCCALETGKMANFWLHNGFVQVEGQKMSKSLGNFITIRQALETKLPQTEHLGGAERAAAAQWAGLAMRLAMLQTHYRSPLDWTRQRLEESSAELFRWYAVLRQNAGAAASAPAAMAEALADDMNTPSALAALRQAYKNNAAAELRGGMALLGLYAPQFADADSVIFARKARLSAAETEARIAARAAFIEAKNWAEADKIRDALAEMGIRLQDSVDKKSGKRVTKWLAE